MTNKSSRIAIFPASFDPITIGHIDIIKRAALMFDKLIVLVANNYAKSYLLSLEQRLEVVKLAVAELQSDKIDCVASDQLLIDEFRKYNACCVVRGVRNYQDFEYEVNLAHINSELFNTPKNSDQVNNSSSPQSSDFSSSDFSSSGLVVQNFETMYLVASPDLKHISSSLIRELAKTENYFEMYAVNFLPKSTVELVRSYLFPTSKN